MEEMEDIDLDLEDAEGSSLGYPASWLVGFRSRIKFWTRRPSRVSIAILELQEWEFQGREHLARNAVSPWWQSSWLPALFFLLHLLPDWFGQLWSRVAFPYWGMLERALYALPVVPWFASLPFQRCLVGGCKILRARAKPTRSCTRFS